MYPPEEPGFHPTAVSHTMFLDRLDTRAAATILEHLQASDAVSPVDDGAYVNFLGEDGPARIHQAYPGPTWERLVAVKRRWDPTNLFRHNHNIPPGG